DVHIQVRRRRLCVHTATHIERRGPQPQDHVAHGDEAGLYVIHQIVLGVDWISQLHPVYLTVLDDSFSLYCQLAGVGGDFGLTGESSRRAYDRRRIEEFCQVSDRYLLEVQRTFERRQLSLASNQRTTLAL